MGHRIRELEDALSIMQSSVSSEPHPLLREDLLGIKFGPERRQPFEKELPVPKPTMPATINAMGTLTIGDRGEAKYFGPSAGSEVCHPCVYILVIPTECHFQTLFLVSCAAYC